MRITLCTLKYSENVIIIVTLAKMTVHRVLWHYVYVMLVFDTSLDFLNLISRQHAIRSTIIAPLCFNVDDAFTTHGQKQLLLSAHRTTTTQTIRFHW
jgi:hypothetical protein